MNFTDTTSVNLSLSPAANGVYVSCNVADGFRNTVAILIKEHLLKSFASDCTEMSTSELTAKMPKWQWQLWISCILDAESESHNEEPLCVIVSETTEGVLTSEILTLSKAISAYGQSGTCANTNCREELKGQPQLRGLLGPMWGGDKIPLRYESQAAYNTLSV